MKRYYVNLTAGLAYSAKIDGDVVYCHLQSSHIESKAWNKFFICLPDDLLLHLALGYECYIIDCSANCGGKSKVIRMGIPAIKLLLNKRWFDKFERIEPFDLDYCKRILDMVDKSVKNKMDYFKKFLKTEEIKLFGLYERLEKEDTESIILNGIKQRLPLCP